MAKVALLKNQLSGGGGLEKQARLIAHKLAKRGHEVSLLCGPGQILDRGPLIPRQFDLPPLGKSLSLLFLARQFDKWLKKNPQDVVLGLERCLNCTHYRAGNGVHAAFLAHREKKPFWGPLSTLTPHHQTVLYMERRLFAGGGAKKVIVNSHYVAQQLVDYHAVSRNRIRVIHNGVDWKGCAENFCDKLREIPSRSADRHFLFVGNGFARKGLDLLLEALSGFRSESWKLDVVGRDRRIGHYCQMAQSLGIGQRVHFHGTQSELLPFYRHCDTLLLPSRYDPFANVTIEALAMGMPVVSSPYNGGIEAFREGSGYVTDDLSICALREGIEWAMTRSYSEEMHRSIRNSVENFDLDQQLSAFIDTLFEDA